MGSLITPSGWYPQCINVLLEGPPPLAMGVNAVAVSVAGVTLGVAVAATAALSVAMAWGFLHVVAKEKPF